MRSIQRLFLVAQVRFSYFARVSGRRRLREARVAPRRYTSRQKLCPGEVNDAARLRQALPGKKSMSTKPTTERALQPVDRGLSPARAQARHCRFRRVDFLHQRAVFELQSKRKVTSASCPAVRTLSSRGHHKTARQAVFGSGPISAAAAPARPTATRRGRRAIRRSRSP